MENSSLGRDTVVGRLRYDILRTFAATCMATKVNFKEYVVFLLKCNPFDISDRPELYTPQMYMHYNNKIKGKICKTGDPPFLDEDILNRVLSVHDSFALNYSRQRI